jgi:hypothetical protein
MPLEKKRRLSIALSVLRQITQHCAPDSSEIAALQSLAQSQEELAMPIDDLACLIVKRELASTSV